MKIIKEQKEVATMKIKREVVGGATAVMLVASSLINLHQLNNNKKLEKIISEEQEQHKIQIQEHEQEALKLTNELSVKNGEIDNLQQQINQLEAENNSLEGVQQSIINNVGYVPNTYERQLLEMLVECEAGTESMSGKIAVANVVLNRLKSEKFPDSISEIIYQRNQFEPVGTGVIDTITPSQESIDAVKRAFVGEKVLGEDVIYFWAVWLDANNDLWNHVNIVTTIGGHHFGMEWN